MKIIKILVVILILNSSSSLFSQDGISYTLSADIVSRFIDRGLEVSGNPNFQPSLSLKYSKQWGVIEAGLWSSYAFNEAFNEIDFYLTYIYSDENLGSFSLSVYDYIFPFSGKSFNDFSNNGEGAHTLELIFQYEGKQNFPISFELCNIIYNNFLGDGSLYFEFGYLLDYEKFSFELLMSLAEGKSQTYLIEYDKFLFNSLGINFNTQISLNENFNLPVSLRFHRNLNLEKNFYCLVFSF